MSEQGGKDRKKSNEKLSITPDKIFISHCVKYFCSSAIEYTAEGHLHNVTLMKLSKCPASFPLFIYRPILEVFIVT